MCCIIWVNNLLKIVPFTLVPTLIYTNKRAYCRKMFFCSATHSEKHQRKCLEIKYILYKTSDFTLATTMWFIQSSFRQKTCISMGRWSSILRICDAVCFCSFWICTTNLCSSVTKSLLLVRKACLTLWIGSVVCLWILFSMKGLEVKLHFFKD